MSTDPAPVTNWSFPTAHHFNAAGWYHAVFLTCMSGLLAGLVVGASRRLRNNAESALASRSAHLDEIASSRWSSAAVFCGVAFVGLLAIDESGTGTRAGWTTIVIIAGLAALGVTALWYALGQRLRLGVPGLLRGLIAAAAAVTLSAVGLAGTAALNLVAGTCALLVALGISAMMPRRVLPDPWLVLVVSLVLLGSMGCGMGSARPTVASLSWLSCSAQQARSLPAGCDRAPQLRLFISALLRRSSLAPWCWRTGCLVNVPTPRPAQDAVGTTLVLFDLLGDLRCAASLRGVHGGRPERATSATGRARGSGASPRQSRARSGTNWPGLEWPRSWRWALFSASHRVPCRLMSSSTAPRDSWAR